MRRSCSSTMIAVRKQPCSSATCGATSSALNGSFTLRTTWATFVASGHRSRAAPTCGCGTIGCCMRRRTLSLLLSSFCGSALVFLARQLTLPLFSTHSSNAHQDTTWRCSCGGRATCSLVIMPRETRARQRLCSMWALACASRGSPRAVLSGPECPFPRTCCTSFRSNMD